MSNRPPAKANGNAADELRALARSFEWSLRAANLSALTVKTYLDAVQQLDRYLRSAGHSSRIPAIERAHLEAFIADQLDRWEPATAANRFRGLRRFFADDPDQGPSRFDGATAARSLATALPLRAT